MVRVPRILLVVPGIVAGFLVPAVVVHTPKAAPPNTVGMVNMAFSETVVHLDRGQRITFVDSSRNIHEIGPGHNGQVTTAVHGDPLTGFKVVETNGRFTTGPWMIPGTYQVTCAIHPTMNLTVVVRK